jgi:long-chain fatty acid transport protein
MISGNLKTLVAVLAASAAMVSGVQANGFSRGNADTDIIYEDGRFDARLGVVYTTPNRGYETINGAAVTDSDYSDSYAVPTAAAKFNITEDLRCAGTYTQPFGADVSYGPQAIVAGLTADRKGTASMDFVANELGLTCGYKFKAGPGNLWLLGGAFVEDISYHEGTFVGGISVPNNFTTLELKENYQPGYRLGAAYDVPEIALRVQAMYRSEVVHNLDGTFYAPAALAAGSIFSNPSAVGSATLPQSFEIKAQTGVAPGWLVFGSVKWTNWAAFDVLTYTSALGAPANRKEFYFKDGWTYSLGVGHKFNDKLSGSLSLTYDQGVSTTEDVHGDTITLASGVQFNLNEMTKISVGGAISHLQGGSVALSTGAGGIGPGHKFAYTVGDDWAYTVGANILVKF